MAVRNGHLTGNGPLCGKRRAIFDLIVFIDGGVAINQRVFIDEGGGISCTGRAKQRDKGSPGRR